jgi:general nucleoside transport system permease protein
VAAKSQYSTAPQQDALEKEPVAGGSGSRLERRLNWRRFLLSWFALPGALLAALALGAAMMAALGANPVSGYHALIDGAFDGSYALGASAVKAAPLLLVGVGICIAFRANMLNIGGEGQLAMGGLASAATALALPNLPSIVLIPLVLLAGAAGGAVWGAIPGVFKAYFNVNEILSTIMLNLVAVQVMNYLLAGPMVDKTQNSTYGLIPETKLLPHNSWLPILIPGTQLHLGVLIAVVIAVGSYVLLWRTGFGFRLRAVGSSRDASNYAGMPVKRTMTLAMTLSGAMCGLGGALLVFGSIAHRMVTDGSLTGFTGSDGFNGIVVALFGALNPLWTIVSSFLFGGLLVGGDALQVATGVPADVVTALEGLVVVFVVSLEYMRRRARASAPIPSAVSPMRSPFGKWRRGAGDRPAAPPLAPSSHALDEP